MRQESRAAGALSVRQVYRVFSRLGDPAFDVYVQDGAIRVEVIYGPVELDERGAEALISALVAALADLRAAASAAPAGCRDGA